MDENSPLAAAADRVREAYVAGDAIRCGVEHHNFAADLSACDAPAGVVLAHLVASAAILYQMNSPVLSRVLGNLARFPLEGESPSLDDVRLVVEETPGVTFASLIEDLPRRAGGAQSAIAEIWRLAREAAKQSPEASAHLPLAISQALASGDRDQLLAAMERLGPSEMEQTMRRLHEAGIVDEQALATLQALRALGALVQLVAAATLDPARDRSTIERALADMEKSGWNLRQAIHRLWQGERDREALTTDLAGHEASLILRALDLIEKAS